jgi:hypothetical protein
VTGKWSRGLAIAGAAGALALATVLVLVALDARAWQQTIRNDDGVLRVAPERARWSPDERDPFGTARRLLAISDDIALRRAARLFQLSRHQPLYSLGPGLTQEAGRARAEIALAAVERDDPRRRDRAIAAELLGVLAFDKARNEPRNVGGLLRRSAAAFRRAIALDPTADQPKTNLEIVLRLTGRAAEANRQRLGLFGNSAGHGSGSGRGGEGY